MISCASNAVKRSKCTMEYCPISTQDCTHIHMYIPSVNNSWNSRKCYHCLIVYTETTPVCTIVVMFPWRPQLTHLWITCTFFLTTVDRWSRGESEWSTMPVDLKCERSALVAYTPRTLPDVPHCRDNCWHWVEWTQTKQRNCHLCTRTVYAPHRELRAFSSCRVLSVRFCGYICTIHWTINQPHLPDKMVGIAKVPTHHVMK